MSDPPPGAAMRDAAERGRLLHALFERLPAVSPPRRRDAAIGWLMGPGGIVARARADALAADALAVIDHPDFADWFADDALAEAPFAAVVDGQVIAGTVDRMVVREDAVHVLDFKTGRRAPGAIADIPAYHRRQMAAYSTALRVLFPGRRITASLLYTAGPVLHRLPEAIAAPDKPDLGRGAEAL